MMIYFFLFSVLYIVRGAFKSYSGGNCGFVYDVDAGSINNSTYPLDVCITDYNPSNSVHPYLSRMYECMKGSDGKYDIELYTYYGTNCSGKADESRSALSPDNKMFNCGDDNNATMTDDCYVEYKRYDIDDSSSSECTGWNTASYTTEYIVVGACIAGRDYKYSRCNPDNNDVEYVLFNDDECCDLSYIYTAKDGPDWKKYDISTGCNEGVYIDPDSWTCLIPDAADDPDVFTDNTDEECTDNAHRFIIYGIVSIVITAVISM